MTDLPDSTIPTQETSTRRRGWRWLRALLWGIAALWLLVLSAWLVLHVFILPRIDAQRGWLQERLSRALSTPVVIGELQVQGNWLLPWVQASDVVIIDAQGRAALHLPRVVAAVTPWSLLRGTVEQLLIDQPVLDVRRDAQGRWWLAGLPLPDHDGDTAASDWLFSQPEWVIRSGRLLWRDELRDAQRPGGAPTTLTLDDVDLVLRNHLHRHDIRIDATPPEAMAARISLRGQFTQSPLHRAGDWQGWSGQIYADLPRLDLARWPEWLPPDERWAQVQGQGHAQAWIDVQQGRWIGGSAQLDMTALRVSLGPDLPPLALRQIQGQLGYQVQGTDQVVSTRRLRFVTEEGDDWPGGDVRVSWRGASAEAGSLQAEHIDLPALARVVQRLPVPSEWRQALAQGQPRGRVPQLQASWQTEAGTQTLRVSARGRVEQAHWLRDPAAQGLWASLPGVSGASLDFDFNERGGKARLDVREGSLTLPSGLDEPQLPLSDASVQLAWQAQGGRWGVQFSQGRIANADLAGEFSGQWTSGLAAQPWPGTLDLTASLSRAQAQAVHRYLPSGLPEAVRRYVREAVPAGQLAKTQIRIKGDLARLPFTDAKQGEFRIATQISDGRYAYVLPQPKTPDWPQLTGIQGELVFERNGLTFKGSTRMDGAPHLGWHKVEARIADFDRAQLHLQADGRGPLDELLPLISRSAINGLIDGVLDKAQGNGDADYKLALELPLNQPDQARVKGSVTFNGNDVQVMAGTPVLTRASGQLQFSEQGFDLRSLKGRMLGGDAELQGGLRFGQRGGDSPVQLRIKGNLSADGLRQARELGFVSRLAARASGRADYQAVLGLRRNQPELLITSDLKGLALNLPAPLGKPAALALPLRVETQLTRESLLPKSQLLQDQLRVSLGRVLSLAYLRDVSGDEPKVLQGGVAVGLAAANPPAMTPGGVTLNMQWGTLDLDAWNDVLSEWTGGVPVVRPLATVRRPGQRVAIGGRAADTPNAMDYVPVNLAVVADQVRVANRDLHRIVAGGTRVGDLWRFNVYADELNGAIELRPPSGDVPAQLYARLSRLVVPPSALSEVDQMLSPQPSSIPALDVVVNDFTLRNRALGRLEMVAINRAGAVPAAREWVLNKLNLTMPEASLSARGNWAASASGAKRTQLDFSLDIRDSGDLLTRFGMAGVVRDGAGKIEGQIGWLGSPLTPDYPSLGGTFNVLVEKGQFLKTEPGVGRLLGVLNLQALPRRLTLDFSDIFSEGFAFDFVRGDVRIEQGVARTNNLQMKGVSAAALIEGESDLARETQDLKVVVVPEINAGNVSLYLATINPLIGLTNYLAQLVLAKPLARAGTSEFRIDGTWSQPRVTKVDS